MNGMAGRDQFPIGRPIPFEKAVDRIARVVDAALEPLSGSSGEIDFDDAAFWGSLENTLAEVGTALNIPIDSARKTGLEVDVGLRIVRHLIEPRITELAQGAAPAEMILDALAGRLNYNAPAREYSHRLDALSGCSDFFARERLEPLRDSLEALAVRSSASGTSVGLWVTHSARDVGNLIGRNFLDPDLAKGLDGIVSHYRRIVELGDETGGSVIYG